MDIKVIVAAHKKYRMPEDEMYLPVHVGSIGKNSIGYQRDDIGENISYKNPRYCELTGIYWAWKNLKCDAVGLAHYRRHFAEKDFKTKDKFELLLTKKTAEELFEKTDVILPKKRNYYIENIYSHYVHSLYPMPLAMTEEFIRDKYPEYYPAFQRLHTKKSAHMFNMFIMKWDVFDQYCTFLFKLLQDLEDIIPEAEYEDTFEARFFGRVSEVLLDVFLETRGIDYLETGYVNIEGENWIKKITMFLKAKLFGTKYTKSV